MSSVQTAAALPADVAVQGICDDRFGKVREVFAANFHSGEEIGASAAVFIDGEPVVDIWGGYFDEACTRPWERDTIVNMFSTTKTMTALCALILADRGELDLNAPVAKYWREFAVQGKGGILVRHLLGHTAAMCGWTETMTLDDILDWEKSTTLLARQAPWFEPGKIGGYHPMSYGPLIGEVVRRVTGKTLKAFFAEEVARPLGADYYIGAPAEADARVSVMIQGSPLVQPTGDLLRDRAYHNPLITPGFSGTIGWRRADLGGSNGHGNARSVALVQSVLSCGGEVGGVRLLSRAGCERALETQTEGPDRIFGFNVRWGLGYALENPALVDIYGPHVKGRRVAGWGGSGGSFVMNDLDSRMTVAYVMNRHLEHGGIDPRGIGVIRAAFEGLYGTGHD
jgi:CubicO group peptidase (beta-lactamase class C family)